MEPDEKRHKEEDAAAAAAAEEEHHGLAFPHSGLDQNGMPVINREMYERCRMMRPPQQHIRIAPSLPGDPKDHVRIPVELAHLIGRPPTAFEGDLSKAKLLDAHICNSEVNIGGLMRRKVEYLGRNADNGRHQYKVTRFTGLDEQGRPEYSIEITTDIPEANNIARRGGSL